MTRKTALTKQASNQGNLATKEVEAEIKTLLKAAAIMPDGEAEAHVRQQSGHIFDKAQPVSLEALKLRLEALQAQQATIKSDLVDKRNERKKQSRFISDNTVTEEDNIDEEE
ncbi:hypothetical protein EYS14_00105 [Alteromonadaceae bacterium M269]|nr:hypothetical protein EYS14_00105 [Alteromonadaceae bacterium M269]